MSAAMRSLALLFVFLPVLSSGLGCAREPSAENESGSAALATGPAAPIALSGTFRPGGTAEAVGRLTTDVIDTRMSDASARLESLQADGADCQFVGADTYRCTKLHPASDVPAASLDAISTQNRGVFATFGEVTGAPTIASQGDSLVDWQVPQTGESSGGAFTFYTYREMDGVTKLLLPARASTLELLVRDKSHLGKRDSHTVTESRWRFHQDMAVVVLAKD
jgi:hypothetical protein